jgi:lysophospholipase L1-like esterase
MAISFDTPAARDGQGSVSVTCSPASGATFPIGTTEVKCTATDSLNRTGECSFNVIIAKLAQLARVRYLAFGDSLTAGEVTFPVGSLSPGMALVSKQVVVPSAAYPTILARTLQGRYASQAESIVVANYGLGGEKAAVARDRFFQALNIVRPEVVLLMEGYNDIPAGENGAASRAASELEIMAAEARNRGMRVFLATLLPPRPGGNRSIGQIYIDDYNNRMRIVASRQGAVLVDLYAAILPDVQRYIGVDGLHPNEAGYARIADVFFQAIQANLEVR